LIPTVFWLLSDFLSLKNDVNDSSKSNKQKNLSATLQESKLNAVTSFSNKNKSYRISEK
jgi:hypothetical protein